MDIYAIVIILIVAGLLALSVSRIRFIKTKADFLVAGRSLAWPVLVFTLLSSWIGAGSLFGGAENAYRNGFAALWSAAGGWAGLLVIYFVAARARAFAQYTVPDLLEVRYNTAARVLGAIAILLAFTAIASYQFKGGGDILHILFPGLDAVARDLGFAAGHERALGTIIIALFVITFTALAGMQSVAYLDVVIGVLIIVGAFLAFPLLLSAAGGWAGVQAALPPEHFQLFGRFNYVGDTPPSTALAFTRAMELFIPTLLLLLGNQTIYQKFFSARSQRDAKLSVLGWIGGTFILEVLIVALAVVGTALFVTRPDLIPREIIPYTARNGLNAWPLVGAVLIGGVLAQVISTANNYLFSPATNLINDVYSRFVRPRASQREMLIASRLLVIGLGGFALMQSAFWESMLERQLYAYTVYSAAITPVVLAAFFWKRATAAAAVTSIALGTIITVAWNVFKLTATAAAAGAYTPGALGKVLLNLWMALPEWLRARDAVFPAVFVSVLALVVVSYLTRPPRPEQVEPFFTKVKDIPALEG
jgi:SSS family solute:Na+ symporter